MPVRVAAKKRRSSQPTFVDEPCIHCNAPRVACNPGGETPRARSQIDPRVTSVKTRR